jgi:hypothetical protein
MIQRATSILSILLFPPVLAFGASVAQDDPCRTSVAPSPPQTTLAMQANPADGAPAASADPLEDVAICPGSFCSAQQRTQCTIRCHGHGIGLLCDFSICTSECICGSVPPGLEPMDMSPASPPDPSLVASGCPGSFCSAQQRKQCSIQCHGKGIGLVCDFSTCTSQCICGSVPPG